MILIEQLLFFILGAMIGSFCNVVIYRWPREESFVSPRSKCTTCKAPIPAYYNIPILGWLILRGKANCCGDKISFRYPFVEALTGFCFLLTYIYFGLSFQTFEICLFFSMAIPCFFIDLEHYLLPDIYTYPGIVFGIVGSFYSQTRTPLDSISGVLLGGGLLWFTAWAYEKARKMEGMGLGDVKLLAWLGALVGVSGLPFIIFISCLMGTAVGVFLMIVFKKGRLTAIPFGPFLISAALVYIFIPEAQTLFLRMFFPF